MPETARTGARAHSCPTALRAPSQQMPCSDRLAAGPAGRGVLAGNDGAYDPEPGCPGDVADHMMQLQVHQGKRLLHVLDVAAE